MEASNELCCICLEELPNKIDEQERYLCCGKTIHNHCSAQLLESTINKLRRPH